MAKPSKDKVRVSLDISPDEHTAWLKTKVADNSGTLIGMLRRAIELFRIVREHINKPGCKVVLRHADGTDEILRWL